MFGVVFIFLVSLDASSQVPSRNTCLSSGCHGRVVSAPYVHSPLRAKGGCLACHRPGEGLENLPAKHPPLKKLYASELTEICTVCHDDILAGKFMHPGLKEKSCVACHDPHGNNSKRLLKVGEPPVLCLSCHEKLSAKIKGASYTHSPVLEKSACMNCHLAHTSESRVLLKSKETEVCLSCHSKAIALKDDRKIAGFADRLSHSRSVHKPIQEGKCSGCHDPHGGSRPKFLKESYALKLSTSYDQNDVALCFECHSTDLVTERTTTEATNFRMGPKNLHSVHLLQGSRSCRVCHDVHASSNAKLFNESMQFVGVQIPLKFEVTKTGGTCLTACHGWKSYDRVRFKNED